ncbi:hypothetical protein I5V12_00345 [Stenotrophomonas maltophilia]|uniref:Pepco domain-containing protein n=1 Tax=unclassified Stenotrophomonas TaxID=196198 RepID=UPI0018D4741B|nr:MULTISPECIES: hypothetical protein [unclassified Stenotrophomonas]MBH1736046.1 hypothetical protein [Stenotrophomonas maltophilia]WNB79889.1 hypothetical protein Q9R16_19115 [Stenotrophomonas sp. 9]
MTKKDKESLDIAIFVPGDTADTTQQEKDPAAINHGFEWFSTSRVERVNATIMSQWEGTINRLMEMSALIGSKAKDWTVDEIEVGFTLSAKGELLFIAEAGAEASITVTLKRKAPNG